VNCVVKTLSSLKQENGSREVTKICTSTYDVKCWHQPLAVLVRSSRR
jgi:hypothetical protein